MITDPENFARRFAQLFGAKDARGLSGLLAEDADVLALTGLWCEDRATAETTFDAEFAGAFAKARIVTGKGKLRPMGGDTAVLHQRYVLSGLIDAQGQDLGRQAIVMAAVLSATQDGWKAVSLHLSATEG